MNKSWYQSKAIWGIGIAGIIALGQVFGIPYSDATITSVVQLLSGILGAIGIRTAIK